MEQMTLGLMLLSGLFQINRPASYEAEHFYYHDRQNNVQALLLTNKILLADTEAVRKYIAKWNLKHEQVRANHFFEFGNKKTLSHKGFVISLKNRDETLLTMQDLAENSLPFTPVVRWQGADCAPRDRIILQAKPFVTEDILRKRLTSLGLFKFTNLFAESRSVYSFAVSDIRLLPNIITLANMLSEDTPWFVWARPDFYPIHTPIVGYFRVSEGNADLGVQRTLDIVINIYSPAISIDKASLPKPADVAFLPSRDDFWYDFGDATISETVRDDLRTIVVSMPFRNFGKDIIVVQPIRIPFEYEKEQLFLNIQSLAYKNTSIIDGTDINNIQPIAWAHVPSLISATSQPQALWSKTQIGIGVFTGGFGLMGACFVVSLLRLLKRPVDDEGFKIRTEIWEPLKTTAKMITSDVTGSSWRTNYEKAERLVTKVIAYKFGIERPVSSEEAYSQGVVWGSVINALRELENLYKGSPSPNYNEMGRHLFHIYEDGLRTTQ